MPESQNGKDVAADKLSCSEEQRSGIRHEEGKLKARSVSDGFR